MMQSEVESELLALRRDIDEIANAAQLREAEWRRLGLISTVSGIVISLIGAGFLVANVITDMTGLAADSTRSRLSHFGSRCGIHTATVAQRLLYLAQDRHRWTSESNGA